MRVWLNHVCEPDCGDLRMLGAAWLRQSGAWRTNSDMLGERKSVSLSVNEELLAAEALANLACSYFRLPIPIDREQWCHLAGVALHWSNNYEDGLYVRNKSETS